METIITTLNEWFGYISNIAIGAGSVFVILLTRTLYTLLKGNAFGEKVVTLGVLKLKTILSNDTPERKELIELIEGQPEFQAILSRSSDFINTQKLELKRQVLDIETKLVSGVLDKPQFEKYKDLLVELTEQLDKYEK